MPDPTRPPPPPPPAAPTRPAPPPGPTADVKPGDFDDSAAGEEDPGASVDTLLPRP